MTETNAGGRAEPARAAYMSLYRAATTGNHAAMVIGYLMSWWIPVALSNLANALHIVEEYPYAAAALRLRSCHSKPA